MAKKSSNLSKNNLSKSKEPKRQLKEKLRIEPPQGSIFEGLVVAFFAAFIILIVRMHGYVRPMDQFFWSGGDTQLSDFFSYYKMVAILIAAILAVLIILYRFTTQTLVIQKSYAYIPMAVYAVFVLLSYFFSDYKEFALYGYNDRFEGTVTLLSYMVMLFFLINYIHSERNVKWVVYPLGISSAILGLLGLTQALDHDFFRTTFGKKLITPSSFWENVDSLNFTFQNREIYQTVYNINYVSFYLTLLVPLFAMLFLRESAWKKKVLWGALLALLIYNLIGSKSSGGIAGLAVSALVALIVLNRRLLQWKKPLIALLVITAIVGGLTFNRWTEELSGAINSVLGRQPAITQTEESASQEQGTDTTATNAPGTLRPHIDYIETNEDSVVMSFNGNPLTITITKQQDGSIEGMTLADQDGKAIAMMPTEEQATFTIEDERFREYATLSYASDGTQYYILLNTPEVQWAFAITEEGILYSNQLGKLVDLEKIPAVGWENNQRFGSGRGYIWSRTLPMIKDTLLIGHGADTYCLYFPHQDYAGKYSSEQFPINIIVDKPHNMYMGAAIGTGLLSILSLMVLWAFYLIQSLKLYWKAEFKEDFNTYVGAGIFFGISGFLVAGLVNDSTVSVMPMFYTLLGTGIAINRLLVKSTGRQAKTEQS